MFELSGNWRFLSLFKKKKKLFLHAQFLFLSKYTLFPSTFVLTFISELDVII